MSQKLVIGPIDRGIRTDRTAFNIDNDSFPVLTNAYQWRGRIKRKRGTSFLGRLARYFDSTSSSYTGPATPYQISLVSGGANLLSGPYVGRVGPNVVLQPNGNIVPGSLTITDQDASITYTDPASDGVLVGSPSGMGTVNYATGGFTLVGGSNDKITAQFTYYPDLPVLGLEDLVLNANQFPGTLAFDTTYSYNISTSFPYNIYDVSFYKNPPLPQSTYPGYNPKTAVTSTDWNGHTYQQFWTVNYQGALWATNGINYPFSAENVGMQYKPVTNVAITSAGPPAIANVTIANHGLVAGDFLFFNEFSIGVITGLNFQTGYVTAVIDTNTVTVEFPIAVLTGGGATSTGIAQYLTNRSSSTMDCLRWYDGDPTSGPFTPPVLNTGLGWVNFAPPLGQGVVSIDDSPEQVYYLVGARMIVPFKDRLLFIGPVIQTSTAGSQIYLQDTVIFSANATPYYTASFAGSVDLATTTFSPLLVPANQNAFPPSYFCDQPGFGGFISAGIAQPILTAGANEDVLILGFSNKQSRLVYTSNDLTPFLFYIINSEYGSASTFSAITLDRGIMSVGNNGIILTSQVGSERIDLQIPDNIFQFNLTDNGAQRVTAQRDFINEWMYFTYSSNQSDYIYPDQTLQYNYRDVSWAIFNESYTTYGSFRRQDGYTWATIGMVFPTWAAWNEPWEAGESTLLQPQVIGGNQQGFIVFRGEGTEESNSLYIQGFSGSVITSPDHTLSQGDYIVISGCIGSIASQVNGMIFSVSLPTENTFILNPSIGSGTYSGGGVIQRMYVPFVQTKQFPLAWSDAKKTRIDTQHYLLSKTDAGQIQLLIFLSENNQNAYNSGPIVPSSGSLNNSLIYSTVLNTSPDLQLNQIVNASIGIIGNGSLSSITLSFPAPIIVGTLQIAVGNVATFSDNGNGGFNTTGTGDGLFSSVNYTSGVAILFFYAPPSQQNTIVSYNYYSQNIQNPTASTQQQIWHRVNTSLLGDTVQLGFTMSDAQMRDQSFASQFSEIELHSIVMSVSPSGLLA